MSADDTALRLTVATPGSVIHFKLCSRVDQHGRWWHTKLANCAEVPEFEGIDRFISYYTNIEEISQGRYAHLHTHPIQGTQLHTSPFGLIEKL